MGMTVYANGMSVACKAADGKTIAAMPDVCLSPPSPPAGPIPIPYPNTAMASDTTNGSKTVQIGGQEVMLKDKSTFKKSTGDEAATKSFGMGVVSHQIQGEVNFCAWSMDVKFEGENIPRNLDLTLHNEMCIPANTPCWPYLDAAAFAGTGPCQDVAAGVDSNCSKHVKLTKGGDVKRKESMDAMCTDKDCKDALTCVISPYSPNNCCPDANGDQPTPHHIVPKSQFKEIGDDGPPIKLKSGATYNANKGPCICVEGNSHSEGDHGDIHAETNTKTREFVGVESGKQIPPDKRWNVGNAESIGAEAVEEVTGCPKDCTEAQVRAGHKAMGINKGDKIRPTTAGGEPEADSGSGY
jgi:hypothetical protein